MLDDTLARIEAKLDALLEDLRGLSDTMRGLKGDMRGLTRGFRLWFVATILIIILSGIATVLGVHAVNDMILQSVITTGRAK